MNTNCPDCAGEIVYEKPQAGTDAECPHCAAAIYLPKKLFKVPRWVWSVAGVTLAAAALGALAWHLLNHYLEDTIAAAGGMFVFAAGCFALVVAVLWIVFPLFMYLKMNELIAEVRKLRERK
jgi:hypothetical protein